MPSGTIDPRSPVVVGVGQLLNRTDQGAEPREPADLMVQSAHLAEVDAGPERILERADIIAAVPTITWRYRDPGSIVAAAFGAQRARTWYANVGGNTPQLLMNRLCRSIAAGELEIGVLVGAEAGRARAEAKRRDEKPEWTIQGDEVAPDWSDDSPFLLSDEAELARSLVMPLQLYPVFENAIWHESGRTLDEHLDFIGQLWSRFSEVAAANPFAWSRAQFSREQIVEVTAENRMVAFPYRKRMVANPMVDMASASIVCSAETARSLGIPQEKWVFVHSGTDAKDRSVSKRASLAHSPAIEIAGNAALRLADTDVDEVDHLDIYACYPSAVQVAMSALGIGADRQLSVYGGLSFAGGPWNNPVGHSIATMVEVIRNDPRSRGLITANGGNIDKHSFGVYSGEPPTKGYRYQDVQDEVDRIEGRSSLVDHDGAASIESWSVAFDRDSKPTVAHIAALTEEGQRTWALCDDPATTALLCDEDVADRRVVIDGRGGFRID